MTSATEMQAQIDGYSRFLMTQKQVLSEEQFAQHAQAMAVSLGLQVGQLPSINTEEATELNSKIEQSEFTANAKSHLMQAVSAKLSADMGSADRRARTQALMQPSAYLTPDDWKVLKDQKITLTMKMTTVADRLLRLGCLHPSENSYKQIVGLIAAAHHPSANASELFNMVLSMKQLMATRQTSAAAGGEKLQVYPVDATLLPPLLLQQAYGEEQPTNKEIGQAVISARVPVRVSNKSVQQPAPTAPHHEYSGCMHLTVGSCSCHFITNTCHVALRACNVATHLALA